MSKAKKVRSTGTIVRRTLAIYTFILLILAIVAVRFLFGADVFKTARFYVDENGNGVVDDNEVVTEVSVKGGEFYIFNDEEGNPAPFFIGRWTYTYSDGTQTSNWYFNNLNLPFILPTAPQKDNCALLGWYTKIDGKETKIGYDFFSNSTKLADIAIYPKYEAVKFKAVAGDTKNGIPQNCYITGLANSVYNLTSLSIPQTMTVSYKDTEGKTRSVTVPVVGIKDNAFSSYKGLTNLTIPSKVTNVAKNAFSGCTAIEKIEAPANVLSVISKASLREVTINAGAEIPADALKDARLLTSIVIPECIKTVGDNAFYGSGLVSVNIPASVETIGVGAFAYCSNLGSITVDQNNKNYTSTNNNSLVLKADKVLVAGCKSTNVTDMNILAIGDYAFAGAIGLSEMILPITVKSIGESAFAGCTALASIDLACVESIADNAFDGCFALRSIAATGNENYVIKDVCLLANTDVEGEYRLLLAIKDVKITSDIVDFNYDYAFKNGVEKVVIDNGALDLEAAVINYANITDVTGNFGIVKYFASRVNSNIDVTVVDTDVIDSIDRTTYLKSLTIKGNGNTVINDNVFYGCTALASVTIKGTVKAIGANAFYNCSALNSVTIGGGVAAIGTNAFYNCSALNSVTIGNGVESIGESAFAKCSSIQAIAIPDSVTAIGAKAFSDCAALASVTIGDGVAAIDNTVFTNSTSIKTIVIPADIASIEGVFNGCYITKATVSEQAIGTFNTSSLEELTIIGEDAEITAEKAYNLPKLTTLTLGKNIKIDAKMFTVASMLNTVSVAAGSDYNVANGCIVEDGVIVLGCVDGDMPRDAKAIGAYAFAGRAVTEIKIGAVEAIGEYAFKGCIALKTLEISSEVLEEAFDANAFSGCKITTAILPSYALKFLDTASITDITVNDK